jgi:hypothetical protein
MFKKNDTCSTSTYTRDILNLDRNNGVALQSESLISKDCKPTGCSATKRVAIGLAVAGISSAIGLPVILL